MLTIFDFINLSVLLFCAGLWGLVVVRTNFIIILLSLELILFSINMNFLIYSVYLNDLGGSIFSIIILTVAAAESAIGLAILVVYYRLRGVISVDLITALKG